MKNIRNIIISFICLLTLASCSAAPSVPTHTTTAALLSPREKYVNASGQNIQERFYTPVGARRTPEQSGSLGAYTRSVKLKQDNEQLLLYNGKPAERQDKHAAIFIYQTPPDNKQQVAGAVMRIWSEYLYASGRKSDISFMLTNGLAFGYEQWQQGFRPDFRTQPKMVKNAEPADSYENFYAYLTALFQYSDIRSLEGELEPVKLTDMRIGDVFIATKDGGHAAMVVDICKSDDGKTFFMLAGGGSPAQDVHVFTNPDQYVWYELPSSEAQIVTPEYTFPKGTLKRFIDL